MTESERSCPDCGERLSLDARQCACGWGKPKAGRHEGPRTDMRCTYKAGSDRCQYPVGMFPAGASSGWCIFHRQPLQAGQGAEITRQSHSIPYLEALQTIQEANKDNANVRALREQIAKRSTIRHEPEDAEAISNGVRRGRAGAAR